MSSHVYKKIEIIGSSVVSVEDAVKNAIEAASKTIKNLEWFEVAETRGHLQDGKIGHWQVTLKVGFRVEA